MKKRTHRKILKGVEHFANKLSFKHAQLMGENRALSAELHRAQDRLRQALAITAAYEKENLALKSDVEAGIGEIKRRNENIKSLAECIEALEDQREQGWLHSRDAWGVTSVCTNELQRLKAVDAAAKALHDRAAEIPPGAVSMLWDNVAILHRLPASLFDRTVERGEVGT